MQKHVGFIFGVDLNDTDLCAAVAVLVYSSESRAFPRARAPMECHFVEQRAIDKNYTNQGTTINETLHCFSVANPHRVRRHLRQLAV